MVRDTKSSIKLIIDTSTFFSALYNRRGPQARLFELADKGRFEIVIFKYVLDELEAVFKRKGLEFEQVRDLMDTYRSLVIEDIEVLTDAEIELAKLLISDPKDRPIFVFAHQRMRRDSSIYFVSGDRVFFTEHVVEALDRRVLHTRQFLELVGE